MVLWCPWWWCGVVGSRDGVDSDGEDEPYRFGIFEEYGDCDDDGDDGEVNARFYGK